MDISSDKLIRLHTEWSGHGKERETLTEKLGPQMARKKLGRIGNQAKNGDYPDHNIDKID